MKGGERMEEERVRTIQGEFYTVPVLAALAGLDPSRIRQLIGDGTLSAIKAERDWLIRRSVGDRWLEDRRREQAL